MVLECGLSLGGGQSTEATSIESTWTEVAVKQRVVYEAESSLWFSCAVRLGTPITHLPSPTQSR
jgi:hypothetical protein